MNLTEKQKEAILNAQQLSPGSGYKIPLLMLDKRVLTGLIKKGLIEKRSQFHYILTESGLIERKKLCE